MNWTRRSRCRWPSASRTAGHGPGPPKCLTPPPASSAGPGAGSPSPAVRSVSQTGLPWRPAHTPGEEGGMVGISWLQACISEWGADPCAPPPTHQSTSGNVKSRGPADLALTGPGDSGGQANPRPHPCLGPASH